MAAARKLGANGRRSSSKRSGLLLDELSESELAVVEQLPSHLSERIAGKKKDVAALRPEEAEYLLNTVRAFLDESGSARRSPHWWKESVNAFGNKAVASGNPQYLPAHTVRNDRDTFSSSHHGGKSELPLRIQIQSRNGYTEPDGVQSIPMLHAFTKADGKRRKALKAVDEQITSGGGGAAVQLEK